MPISGAMDGLAPASTGPVTGSQLDNRRVLAALIDIALLIPVALLMSALFGGFTDAAVALTAGWALYYYFAFESDRGQTLGKRVMKIRVVRADGQPLDAGRVAVRTLLRPIDAIGAYIVGLVVMVATGERRQRIGDLAAGTVVTEADAPVASKPEPEATPAEIERPEVETSAPSFEPFAEPEPEPVVDQHPEPDAPTEEAAEPHAHEPQASRSEIVSSPIDLLMEGHDGDRDEPEAPQDPPQSPA